MFNRLNDDKETELEELLVHVIESVVMIHNL